MAETLFDLLEADGDPDLPERRIRPDDWDALLTPGSAARMVVGGPGTGKTRFLTETVADAVARGGDPERILVLAFSRRGVDDLRTRLVDRIGPDAHRILVSTSHSLAMRLVERHATALGWSRPPTLLTGVEQEARIAGLLATEDPHQWPANLRILLDSEALASEVTDFLLRSADQMLTAPDIAAAGRADWRALPTFMDRYHALLRAEGRIDYGLVLAEALRLRDIDPGLLHRFDLVVADEYQDTAPAQAALLMACVDDASALVVAADPYQSIFSFRGTDIANVYTFPDDVRSTLDRSTERIVLDTSLRVPDEILDAAVAVTGRELPGGAGKVLSRRSGGVIACHEFATVGDEAEWIASDIERLHLLDGVALERIAVFVRADGPFTSDLIRAFDRRDIPHTHSDERLADEPAVRFLHDLVRAATAVEDDDAAALRRVLLGPFVGAPPGLVSSLDDAPSTWPAWIRRHLPEQAPIADLLDDPTWATDADAPTGTWLVWSTVPGLAAVAVGDDAARHRRSWSAYAYALERASARGTHRTLVDQVGLADLVDFEEDTLVPLTDGGVTVATLHRAKGTEFDVVYIADAVEGRLPDLRHRDSILGVRHLHPHLPEATADYVAFRLDEERRLAYTAMTRASTRVVWTATVPTDHGAGSAPSRFMRLVAPTTPAPGEGEPLTPRSLVASVRRDVADPAVPPAERLAGVAWLASGAGGHHRPMDAYGVRARGADDGVRPDAVRLSPSQATEYERCPRRYAVERFLLSRDDDSPYLRLGTAIHRALERAESGALERGDARSSVEDALAELDDAWVDSGFTDDRVGAAWHLRAHRIVRSLYDGWPSTGTVVDVEVPLELTIAGVPWTGRADRLEQSGSRRHIVDYKTGATAMSIDAASESLQLGFYVLAANRTSVSDAEDRVEGASFWYPAATPNRAGIATRHLDPAKMDAVEARLEEITEAILAEEFPATPNGDCGRCPVRTVCPAMSVGREAFAR